MDRRPITRLVSALICQSAIKMAAENSSASKSILSPLSQKMPRPQSRRFATATEAGEQQFDRHLFRSNADSKRPFTVFIEGNIGSGKTTFLNHFRHRDEICAQTEPVQKWQNVGGVNLLELMYREPDRWAMPFQTYVTLTMLQTHTMHTDKAVKLMERSLYSARYCFVENMKTNGILHEANYEIMQQWYDYIEENVHIQADLIVYLRTSPEVVYARMKKRARSEEDCVPLDYLRQLHTLHEDWLIHDNRYRAAPVLVLDANLDLDDIGDEYRRSESSILPTMWLDGKAASGGKQLLMTSPMKRKHSEY